MRKLNLFILLLGICLILTGCLKKQAFVDKPAITIELVFTDSVEKDISDIYLNLIYSGQTIELPVKRQGNRASITLLDIPIGLYKVEVTAWHKESSYNQKVGMFTIDGHEKNSKVSFDVYSFINEEFAFKFPIIAGVGENIAVEAISKESVSGYTWVLEEKPIGSNVVVNSNGLLCNFVPDLSGDYTVRIKKENSSSTYTPITINVYEEAHQLGSDILIVENIEGTSKLVAATYNNRLFIQDENEILAEANFDGYPLCISTLPGSIFLATSSKLYQFSLTGLAEERSWDIVANSILALNGKLLVAKNNQTVVVIDENNEESILLEGLVYFWYKSLDHKQAFIKSSKGLYYLSTDNMILKPCWQLIDERETFWFDNNIICSNNELGKIIVGPEEVKIDYSHFNYLDFLPARNLVNGNMVGCRICNFGLGFVTKPFEGEMKTIGDIKFNIQSGWPQLSSVWYDDSSKQIYGILWHPIVTGEAYLVRYSVN